METLSFQVQQAPTKLYNGEGDSKLVEKFLQLQLVDGDFLV